MLVLTRKPDQDVVITTADGERVTIKVISARTDGKVRLGINAPRDMTVFRGEIQTEIDAGARR